MNRNQQTTIHFGGVKILCNISCQVPGIYSDPEELPKIADEDLELGKVMAKVRTQTISVTCPAYCDPALFDTINLEDIPGCKPLPDWLRGGWTYVGRADNGQMKLRRTLRITYD